MIQINIPMPNNCWECPFSEQLGDFDEDNGEFWVAKCKLLYPQIVMIDEQTNIRPDSCPLKEYTA